MEMLEMRQVAFAVPGRAGAAAAAAVASERRRSQRAALAPVSYAPSVGHPLLGATTGKCPFPSPILTGCPQPGDAVLSLVQGVPEDARRKSKMPPSPEALKQMTVNGTLAPSEHFGSPWFDPKGGGRAKAGVYMALRRPPLPAAPCEARQGSAVRRELLRAPSGAGCERRPVRSVHFWALQDQQKPEKAPGIRSCDWPTRA